MKEVTIQEEQKLKETHTLFWDTNIKAQSSKAFLISCQNSKGAWQQVWIPKSKVAYVMVPDLRPVRLGQDDLFTKVEAGERLRKKYYAPKFFTK